MCALIALMIMSWCASRRTECTSIMCLPRICKRALSRYHLKASPEETGMICMYRAFDRPGAVHSALLPKDGIVNAYRSTSAENLIRRIATRVPLVGVTAKRPRRESITVSDRETNARTPPRFAVKVCCCLAITVGTERMANI